LSLAGLGKYEMALNFSPEIFLWHNKSERDSERLMAIGSGLAFLRQKTFRPLASLGLAALVCGFGGAARAEPFLFPWDPPARHEPERHGVSAPEIRAILAREGARMVGAPQPRGGVIFVIGRDADGARSKFTLDAASGAVLNVERIEKPATIAHAPQERRRGAGEELAAPGQPLPPPQHATEGAPAADPLGAPLGAPPAVASVNPANPAAPPAGSRPPMKNPDSADSALSPIRPIRPVGGPRVEPLPQ
jgi:hypothetical protein